jgi:hypothetical protein
MNIQLIENIIDWKNILELLEDEKEKTYKDIDKNFNFNGFSLLENIKWSEFKTLEDVSKIFADLINCKYHDSIIIKINPGNCVPLHCLNSIYDNDIKIFNCFITDPLWGHTVALKESVLYNIEKNTIHQWNNKDDYHFAANCGTTSFYIFQFAGY